MRKKIEELRNREEGFTLVELLAVLVILAIIVAIAVPVIGNLTEGAQDDADEAEQALIVDAARLYDIENEADESNTAGDTGVSVSTLVSSGFLDLRADDVDAENRTDGVTISREAGGGSVYEYDPNFTSN